MPRKSSQKNRTAARKAAQKARKPKQKQKRVGVIAHQSSGMGTALLAASVMRVARRGEDT